MKRTSLGLNAGIVILFLMITSCNITGEFSLTKRKYTKGYQLKTPELADNKKTHKDRNDNQQSEAKRSTSEIEKNDFIASSETNSIVEFVNIEKPITIININDIKNDDTQPFTTNSKKTFDFKSSKTCKNDSIPPKTNNIHSMIGFFSCCFSYIVLPFQLIGLTGPSMTLLGIGLNMIIFLAPIFAVVFGYIGLRKIKKNPEKFKGKTFAKIAFWGGIGYYVLLVIWAIILLNFII